MGNSRRDFIKMVGVSVIGLSVPPLTSILFAKDKTPTLKEGPAGLSPAPANAPSLKAKRWAMAVDAAKCRPGCTDCTVACHLEHNVPDFGNPKDEIQWIGLQTFAHVFAGADQPYMPESLKGLPLPILCNHCDNPPCVRVCPTKATFRRSDGIVMMDYHRCIGCRFCMSACPFGARSMNYRDPRPFIRRLNPDFPTRTQGVVEKCNFCEERLYRGMLPACVLACKEKALIFGDAEDPRSDVRRLLDRRFSIRRRAELGTKPQVYYFL